MNVNYLEYTDQISKRLGEDHLGVFSTATAEGAKARMVDYVNNGTDIGFFTWRESAKMGEIGKDARVAFCVHEIRIEGSALVRSLDDPGIRGFLETYRAKLPELYQKFTTLPGIVFIVIAAERIKRMVLEEHMLINEILETASGEWAREKLSDW